VTGMSRVLAGEPDAVRCPFPHYRSAAAANGVYHDAATDLYVVTDPRLITEACMKSGIFSNANPQGPQVLDAIKTAHRLFDDEDPDVVAKFELLSLRGGVLFTADPPEHTRHRRLLIKALSRGAVLKVEPEIERICRQLIDSFAEAGRVELVFAYSGPATILGLAKLLGVASERTRDFGHWADAVNIANGHSLTDDEVRDSMMAQLELLEFLEAEFTQRRGEPGDDLLSMILNAGSEDSDEPLSMDEMIAMAAQLIAAGAGSTSKLISMAMYTLASDRDLMSRVTRDKGLLEPLIEETLRLQSPVQGLYRLTTRDTTLGSTAIPAGRYVYLLYAAANRDPSVFESPDRCQVDRRAQAHFAFGRGPHTCPGASLARSVASIALETLLDSLDDIRLAQADSPPDLDLSSYLMRGIRSLPLTFRPVVRPEAELTSC
jgi:cytochrome P450